MKDQSRLTEKEIRAAVTIEPMAIQEEFVRVSGDVYHWSGRMADAIEQLLTARRDLEFTEAEVRLNLRAQAERASIKITEATLDAQLSLDPKYRDARRNEDQAEVNKSRVGGILEAIRTKKDMLISLGATLRAEHEALIRKRD